MIDFNIKENIKSELERQETSMKSCMLLYENNLLSDAISRLYYFLFHKYKGVIVYKKEAKLLMEKGLL